MWKKSEILNNKKFRILLLLEVLLLLVPVIGILRGNKTISTLSDAQVKRKKEWSGRRTDIRWMEAAISMVPGSK